MYSIQHVANNFATICREVVSIIGKMGDDMRDKIKQIFDFCDDVKIDAKGMFDSLAIENWERDEKENQGKRIIVACIASLIMTVLLSVYTYIMSGTLLWLWFTLVLATTTALFAFLTLVYYGTKRSWTRVPYWTLSYKMYLVMFLGEMIGIIVMFKFLKRIFDFDFKQESFHNEAVINFLFNIEFFPVPLMLIIPAFSYFVDILENRDIEMPLSLCFLMIIVGCWMIIEVFNFALRVSIRKGEQTKLENSIRKELSDTMQQQMKSIKQAELEHDLNLLKQQPKFIELCFLVFISAITIFFSGIFFGEGEVADYVKTEMMNTVTFITLWILLVDKRKEWILKK